MRRFDWLSKDAIRVGRITIRIVAVAILALPAAGQAAGAAPSCSGILSGNLIDPLPKPTVISVHVSDSSAQNVALGERFKAGLQAAGVTLASDGPVTMELATSLTGTADSATAMGAVSPEFGFTGTLPISKEPPVLTMSISLMDTRLAQIDWVGYVNCKVVVTDLGTVAQDLGHAIGRVIGQTFPPRRI